MFDTSYVHSAFDIESSNFLEIPDDSFWQQYE